MQGNTFFKKININENKQPIAIDLNSIFRNKNIPVENNLNKNIQNIPNNMNFKSPHKLQRNRIESVSPKVDNRRNQNYFVNNNRKYSIANNDQEKCEEIKINGAQTYRQNREKCVDKLMIIQNIIKNCNSRSNLQQPKNNMQPKLLSSKALMCGNNDNKPGKYYMSSNPTNKYCKKCAIKLISQGIKMTEINNRQTAEQIKQSNKLDAPKINLDKKEQYLHKFTKQVINLQQKVKNEIKKLGKQRDDIFIYVRDQQQKIKIYYDNVIKVINDFKIRDLTKMNQYYQQMSTYFIQSQKELIQHIQMLQSIKNDIIPNIQVIKIKIQDNKILELLKAYKINLSDIQSKLQKENCKIVPPQCFRLTPNRLNYEQICCITYPCQNQFSFEKQLLKQMNNYQRNNLQNVSHGREQIKKQSSMDTNYFTQMIKTFSENANEIEIGKSSPVFKKI